MIVTVGDLVTDVLAVLRAPLATGSDTPATVQVRSGGQAANTAAWIAWLGHPAIFVGAVGDDQTGRDRLAELHAAGVRTQVSVWPAANTGSIVVLSYQGERTMISDRGANLLLAPSDVDKAIALGATHLHLSGYTLLDQASRPAGRAALASAKAAGLHTSVDAASAAPLAALASSPARAVGDSPATSPAPASQPNAMSAMLKREATGRGRCHRDSDSANATPSMPDEEGTFLDWVRGVQVLIANDDEARALVGPGDPAEQGLKLAQAIGGAAVIKLGARGALWAGPEGVSMLAVEPAHVVDATGAGDAFAAGLIVALRAGADIVAALREGCRLGAIAVGQLGARPPAHGGDRIGG